MHAAVRLIAPAAAVLALSACAKPGDLVVNQGVGVTAVRSLCPAVGIPDYTGDITTFSSPTSRLARDMDVEATMTNLRTTCDEQGERIYANATFDVYATRSDTRGARTVELPYFSVVLRGGSSALPAGAGCEKTGRSQPSACSDRHAERVSDCQHMEIPMTRNPNPSRTLDEGNGGTRGGIDPNRPESSMGGQPSLSQGATSFPEHSRASWTQPRGQDDRW